MGRIYNPHKARATAIRRKYGLELEQVDEWIEGQGGVCPICQMEPENTRGWHVDHDHSTGDIRGILCHSCNLGLGLFKDDVERLRRAVAYIRREEITPDTIF